VKIPQWSPQKRPTVIASKPANGDSRDLVLLARFLFLRQVRFSASAPWAFQDRTMVQQAIEHGGASSTVTEQFAPVSTGRLEVSRVRARWCRRITISRSSFAAVGANFRIPRSPSFSVSVGLWNRNPPEIIRGRTGLGAPWRDFVVEGRSASRISLHGGKSPG
jgi:hypothetical protein